MNQLPASVPDFDALAARISTRLAQMKTSATPATEPTISGYEKAAAVLAWFDPQQLQPVPAVPDLDQNAAEIDKLLLGCTLMTDSKGVRRWTLTPTRRIAALRMLRAAGEIDAALAANAGPTAEPMQRFLESGLRGRRLFAEGTWPPELRSSHTVACWLQSAGFEPQPKPLQIASRIEWQALLQSFEHLAGAQFRGREDELRRLREFVDLVPPKSLGETASRIAQRALDLLSRAFSTHSPKIALVLTGPGGVGKSTLLARFLLEHAQAHETERFPFAYLDFDRADVSAEEPLTLLAEMARQIGVQYPELRENCEHLRSTWLDQIARATSAASDSRNGMLSEARKSAIREVASALGRFDKAHRPVVLVLDTFEEVQYHGDLVVETLRCFLEDLRRAVRPLRVVIAGRAELGWRHTVRLALGSFDEASAIAYLAHRGVGNEQLAQKIFVRFGGSPLTLKLAADLATRGDLPELDEFFRQLSEENIQRQLYTRVLDHIHDPRIRSLAHPGLVLRRISPELILEVLAEPCQIEVHSLDEARLLFKKLQQEVALVSVEPDGKSVRHRNDLRQLMLGPLHQDAPEKTQAIHAAAVRFYKNRDSDSDRAEEIYHCLWLAKEPSQADFRWLPRVRRLLVSAAAEFDPRRRAWLAARLRIPVDAETRQAASLPDWERIAARAVAELVQAGLLDAAASLLRERSERTDASRLTVPEADVLVHSGQVEQALEVLDQGFQRATRAGQPRAAARCALHYATQVIRHGLSRAATHAAQRLASMDLSQLSAAASLQAMGQRALLAELAPQARSFAPAEDEFTALVEESRDSMLARATESAWWAAAAPGAQAARRVLAIVRALGIPPVSESALRAFAFDLARFDVKYSQLASQPAGLLGRRLEIPMQASVTESWSTFLVDASTNRRYGVLRSILDMEGAAADPDLIAALQGLIHSALGIGRNPQLFAAHAATRGQHDARKPVAKFKAEDQQALVEAAASNFSVEELRAVLRHRLQRHLEAHTRPGSFAAVVAELVDVTAREGWLLDLAIALMEARPDSELLASAGARLGISTLSGDTDFARILNDARQQWGAKKLRARLNQIERSVCRIEIDGKPCGSGFLIGADLVLTTAAVVDHEAPRGTLDLRFDLKFGSAGEALTRGTIFRAYPFAHDPARELGYLLLRADDAPGAQPIGSSSSFEASAPLRRWIELPDIAPDLAPGARLLVVNHSQRGAMSVEVSKISSLNPFQYFATPETSGTPCFDLESLQPVAIHLGNANGMGTGLSLAEVVRDIKSQPAYGPISAPFA